MWLAIEMADQTCQAASDRCLHWHMAPCACLFGRPPTMNMRVSCRLCSGCVE